MGKHAVFLGHLVRYDFANSSSLHNAVWFTGTHKKFAVKKDTQKKNALQKVSGKTVKTKTNPVPADKK